MSYCCVCWCWSKWYSGCCFIGVIVDVVADVVVGVDRVVVFVIIVVVVVGGGGCGVVDVVVVIVVVVFFVVHLQIHLLSIYLNNPGKKTNREKKISSTSVKLYAPNVMLCPCTHAPVLILPYSYSCVITLPMVYNHISCNPASIPPSSPASPCV